MCSHLTSCIRQISVLRFCQTDYLNEVTCNLVGDCFSETEQGKRSTFTGVCMYSSWSILQKMKLSIAMTGAHTWAVLQVYAKKDSAT